MKRTPYRRRDTALNDVMLKERMWCGRHRCNYMAWDLIAGKLVPARCLRCAEEILAQQPKPRAAEHE